MPRKPGGKGGGKSGKATAQPAASQAAAVDQKAKSQNGSSKAVKKDDAGSSGEAPNEETLQAPVVANPVVTHEDAGGSGEAPCKETLQLPVASNPVVTNEDAGSSGEAGEKDKVGTDEDAGESSPISKNEPEDVCPEAAMPACSSGEAPLEKDPEVCDAPRSPTSRISQEPSNSAGSGEAPETAEPAEPVEPAEPEIAEADVAAPIDVAPESTECVQVGSAGDDQPEVCGAPRADHPKGGSCEAPLHTGGSGEAPVHEEVVQKPQSSGEGVQTAENEVEGVDVLTGDYHWSNGDEHTEWILRICSGGQWWHSAHRSSTERGRVVDPKSRRTPKDLKGVTMQKAYKDFDYEEDEPADLSQLGGDYEDIHIWETAEAIGSWRKVQVLTDTMKEFGSSPIAGVLLTCDNCSWKTNYPNAPLRYKPSIEEEEEVDAMLEEGQLVLCFIVQTSAETGSKSLELHMDLSTVCDTTGAEVKEIPRHARLRSLQTAFQKLGFTKAYMDGIQSSSASQPSRSAEAPETA